MVITTVCPTGIHPSAQGIIRINNPYCKSIITQYQNFSRQQVALIHEMLLGL